MKAKWFDFSKNGFLLGAEKLRDGVARVLLLDVDDKADPDKLLSVGFKRMEGSPAFERGLYYLDSERQSVRPSMFKVGLGLEKVEPVERDMRVVAQEFREAFRQKMGRNLTTALQQARKIGHNKDGHPVFSSGTGRFIQRSVEGGTVGFELVAEASEAGRALGDGRFLYANDGQGLADCADGFFSEIRSGVRMDWSDLERYTKAAFEKHLRSGEVSDAQKRAFQEAVEAAGYRAFFERRSRSIDRASLLVAEGWYNGLPVARMRTAESIALQQYSTPLPMGVVAQRLLVGDDPIMGKSVLEPTAGNGGLVTVVGKSAQVYGIELDSKRAESLRRTGINTVVGDAIDLNYRASFGKPDGFDYTITNPPFGEMDQDRRFDLLPRVKRADYYIALKTLEARKPEGRSVLIVGGDDQRNPGAIRGGTKHFLEYVYDTYEVHGAVELDGRMYSKQGAGANVRMFVVGARRPERIKADIPEKFDVLRTYDETWQWAEGVVRQYEAPAADAAADVAVEIDADAQPVVESAEQSEQAAPEAAPVDSPQAAPTGNQPVERRVNEYQAPYQSASKIAPPMGMIPINMAGATYAALADLEERHGPVDEYVARKLHYKPDELGTYFSPEQVDALGLAISKMDAGRAFTNSDYTGFGKGRFCAAMMRYAKLEGKVPVFLTLTPGLFTDIFRDLKDIDSDHLFKKPFIFNEGVSIMQFGSGTDVLHAPTSAAERRAALESGVLPEGVDVVLASYSQFQRRPEINRKAGLLAAIAAQDTTFVVDEAHVAAGESNVSAAVGNALKATEGVVFASATPFKGAANFRVYGRMFPASVDLNGLPGTLQAGGEALMEAISANMARDGVFIRRELDLSKLEFGSRLPSADRTAFNRETSDRVARILRRMAYLAGDVRKEVNGLNADFKEQLADIPEDEREGHRMQASSMNFGSRLYNISRQFLLSLVVEEAATTAIEALEQGRKPVIAVENTGESLLREVLARRAGVAELIDEVERLKSNPGDDKAAAQERIEQINEQIARQMASVKLDSPPQFRDLLEVMLDRIGVIKVMERYGEYSTHRPSSEGYKDEEEAIRSLIRELPDMPLAALDVVNQRLREKGYEPTEVSGRTSSLSKEELGNGWQVNEHKKANAVANVAGFQNGTYDCITITRAGSTGISLHATDRFADSDIRQREFIVAQKAANIAEFLQWMGRVNRRDQVSHPIMRTLETGLPAESRLTMMHNAKLRRLSANTTSNRDNSNIEGEALDLLNDVGDAIALEWLQENPRIASDLDIQLPKGDEDELDTRAQDCPWINKVMGRMLMVEVETQEEILSTLARRFAEKVEELEQRGINPFKVDVYEWNASIAAEEELVSPTMKITSSTFDEPVSIKTVVYEEDVIPIRKDKLLEMIAKGQQEYNLGRDDDSWARFRESLRAAQERYVTKQLPDGLRQAVEDGRTPLVTALEAEAAGSAKKANERMKFITTNWPYMRPGMHVEFEDPIRGKMGGYITDISLPHQRDSLTSLGAYQMRVVFPGDSRPKSISLATLYNQDAPLFMQRTMAIDPRLKDLAVEGIRSRDVSNLMADYNAAPDGRVKRSAMVLSGNIYRAVELAAKNNLGRPILYTDEHGNRQRAVLMRSHITAEKIKSLPMGMDQDDVLAYIEESDKRLKNARLEQPGMRQPELRMCDNSLMEGPEDGGVYIERVGPNYRMRMPGTKSAVGRLMSDGRIFNIGAKTDSDSLRLDLVGTRKQMACDLDASQLPELLKRLQNGGHFGKFYIGGMDMDIVKHLQQKNRVQAQRTASHDISATATMG